MVPPIKKISIKSMKLIYNSKGIKPGIIKRKKALFYFS